MAPTVKATEIIATIFSEIMAGNRVCYLNSDKRNNDSREMYCDAISLLFSYTFYNVPPVERGVSRTT